MPLSSEPYYRDDLATVHHRGFAFHAELCAPGILALLAPVRERNGLVLEIGCGSGLLTTALIAAGHQVIATDASPSMLELARQTCPAGTDIRRLTLPDDELPEADAIVGVGHALNYLPDEQAIESALRSLAGALRPDGILALDVCDLEWAVARSGQDSLGRVGDDWAIVTRFSTPTPARYVREMTTFLRNDDGTWRRDDERHDNVLVDSATLPTVLVSEGLRAGIRTSFGGEQLPVGLRVLVADRGPSGRHAGRFEEERS